ncbi:MAG: bifunctional nuclease domain-containing protein [Cytophagales bacterium]|nr:bifunctional nuclease domain-containing protein [Cytophagales bacterium]
MEKIKLEILGLSSSQSQAGSFALILGEHKGNRRLPIIIGMFEAQAIAIEIEKIIPNRPMTHDLFKSFSSIFNFDLEYITISDLKEGVFYAKIVCNDGDSTTHYIDARPSDAIAIALRFNAPIYTTEAIISEAGIVMSDFADEEPTKKTKKVPVEKKTEATRSRTDVLKDLSSEQLKALLDDSLKKEDYEYAAIIRDELNKRN